MTEPVSGGRVTDDLIVASLALSDVLAHFATDIAAPQRLFRAHAVASFVQAVENYRAHSDNPFQAMP